MGDEVKVATILIGCCDSTIRFLFLGTCGRNSRLFPVRLLLRLGTKVPIGVVVASWRTSEEALEGARRATVCSFAAATGLESTGSGTTVVVDLVVAGEAGVNGGGRKRPTLEQ